MTPEWQKCFELLDGRPTGRWQWVIDGVECAYYYPGQWVDPESFIPPVPISPATPETFHGRFIMVPAT